MNKVTLTQTKSFDVILSSDTTKGSHEKIISKMAKMDSELKEVKENRCTSTAVVGEIKDQGQLNYAITFILLNRIFSRNQNVQHVTEIILLLSVIVAFNALCVERRSQLPIRILLQLSFKTWLLL